MHLDYNVSSGPFLSFELVIGPGPGPGPELDNIIFVSISGPYVLQLKIKSFDFERDIYEILIDVHTKL